MCATEARTMSQISFADEPANAIDEVIGYLAGMPAIDCKKQVAPSKCAFEKTGEMRLNHGQYSP
jgi:hypothetical protein